MGTEGQRADDAPPETDRVVNQAQEDARLREQFAASLALTKRELEWLRSQQSKE